MKHAVAGDLAGHGALLAAIAERPGVTAKGPGRFYRKANAVLHFHADPAGLFADVKVDGDWVRVAVDEPGGAAELLSLLDRALSGSAR